MKRFAGDFISQAISLINYFVRISPMNLSKKIIYKRNKNFWKILWNFWQILQKIQLC